MERLAVTLSLILVLFASCVSCVKNINRIFLLGEGASQHKYFMSVAMIETTPGIKKHAKVQGTAFAIDNDHLMTAGHLCTSLREGLLLGKAGLFFRLIQSGPDGLPWDDEILARVMVIDEERDMCILESFDHPFIPLTLSPFFDDVEVEDPIVVVGAPKGIFPLRSEGHVGQKEAVKFSRRWGNLMLLKVDIEGGSSGSPVIWANQVIGMIVALPSTPHETALAVPVTYMLEFVEEHLE